MDFIFSREFNVAIPYMDLSKIFDKTIVGAGEGRGVVGGRGGGGGG